MTFHVLLLSALLLLPNVSAAGEDKLLISAVEVGGHHSHYGLAGIIAPLPGNSLGNGFVGRFFASGLAYRYEGSPGRVSADALGGEISLGYQRSSDKGWWGGYAG